MNTYLFVVTLLIIALPGSFVVQYMRAAKEISEKYFGCGFYFKANTENKLTFALYFMTVVVMPIVALLRSDGILSPGYWTVWIALPVPCLTLILGWKHFRVAKFYKKHNKFLAILGAFVALLVSVVVNALVDDLIGEITLVEAATFPAAQKAINIMISMVVWAFAISFAGVVGGMGVGVMALLWPQMSLSKKSTRFMGEPIKKTLRKNISVKMLSMMAILYGLFASTIIVPNIASSIVSSKWFDKFSRGLIVFSSFHLPPSTCGLSTPEGSKIVQIRNKYAVLAVPDVVDGYKFSMKKCNINFAI